MNTLVAVINDDDAVRVSTRALLEGLGYDVHDCTGAIPLQQGAAERGAKLLEHLRHSKRMPAVVISGLCGSMRADTKVLYKPMSDADLIACVEAIWRERRHSLS